MTAVTQVASECASMGWTTYISSIVVIASMALILGSFAAFVCFIFRK